MNEEIYISITSIIVSTISVFIAVWFKRRVRYKKIYCYAAFNRMLFEEKPNAERKFVVYPKPFKAKYDINSMTYIGEFMGTKEVDNSPFEEDHKYGYYVFDYRKISRIYIPKKWIDSEKTYKKIKKRSHGFLFFRIPNFVRKLIYNRKNH